MKRGKRNEKPAETPNHAYWHRATEFKPYLHAHTQQRCGRPRRSMACPPNADLKPTLLTCTWSARADVNPRF